MLRMPRAIVIAVVAFLPLGCSSAPAMSDDAIGTESDPVLASLVRTGAKWERAPHPVELSRDAPPLDVDVSSAQPKVIDHKKNLAWYASDGEAL